MNLEGELRVDVTWDGRAVTRVDVRSSRPARAATVFVGRDPEAAAELAARLFSLCGVAQSLASRLACDAAQRSGAREAARAVAAAPGAVAANAATCVPGAPDADPVTRAHAGRVRAEIVNEHLWRALLDWPALLGEPPFAAALARVRAAGHDAARDVAAPHVYGGDPHAWLADAQSAGLDAWVRAGSTPAARLLARAATLAPLPPAARTVMLPDVDETLARAWIVPAMDADTAFDAAPRWAGEPAETGAVSRERTHPWVARCLSEGRAVLARLGARLVELARLLVERDPARLPPALHAGSLSVARGEGLAWVPTSRGLLLHRARVDAGRIAAYRIVAPTEWNFHPRGALQRGLEGLRATSAAAIESAATTCVQSLDPCVRAVVEVHRA